MEYIIEINGVKYKNVVNYQVDYNQVWQEGSGRDVGTGNYSGTLQGNFTIVNAGIVPENRTELSNLIRNLERGMNDVVYYEPRDLSFRSSRMIRANYSVKLRYVSSLRIVTEVIELKFMPERRN